jgi:hypothetical protein
MDPSHFAYLEYRFRESSSVRAYLGLSASKKRTNSNRDTFPEDQSQQKRQGEVDAVVEDSLLLIFKFFESLNTLKLCFKGKRNITNWVWPPLSGGTDGTNGFNALDQTPLEAFLRRRLRPSSLNNILNLVLCDVNPNLLDLEDLHPHISSLIVQASLSNIGTGILVHRFIVFCRSQPLKGKFSAFIFLGIDQALEYSTWTSLSLLDLSHNKIAFVDANMLLRTPQLTHLILHHNLITKIPEIHGLLHLAHLDVSHNLISSSVETSRITSLVSDEPSENSFTSSATSHMALQDLKIDFNELTTLDNLVHSFPSLRSLSATNNKLQDCKFLRHMKQLRDISLSNNPLSDQGHEEYRISIIRECPDSNHLVIDQIPATIYETDQVRREKPSFNLQNRDDNNEDGSLSTKQDNGSYKSRYARMENISNGKTNETNEAKFRGSQNDSPIRTQSPFSESKLLNSAESYRKRVEGLRKHGPNWIAQYMNEVQRTSIDPKSQLQRTMQLKGIEPQTSQSEISFAIDPINTVEVEHELSSSAPGNLLASIIKERSKQGNRSLTSKKHDGATNISNEGSSFEDEKLAMVKTGSTMSARSEGSNYGQGQSPIVSNVNCNEELQFQRVINDIEVMVCVISNSKPLELHTEEFANLTTLRTGKDSLPSIPPSQVQPFSFAIKSFPLMTLIRAEIWINGTVRRFELYLQQLILISLSTS